jgi:hypothetical protein
VTLDGGSRRRWEYNKTMAFNDSETSRYSVACPVCARRFRPGRSSQLRCPQCNTLLEFQMATPLVALWPVSIVGTGAAALYLGYRGMTLVIITALGAILLSVLGISAAFHLRPPKVQQAWEKGGDTELNLTNRRHR